MEKKKKKVKERDSSSRDTSCRCGSYYCPRCNPGGEGARSKGEFGYTCND